MRLQRKGQHRLTGLGLHRKCLHIAKIDGCRRVPERHVILVILNYNEIRVIK